METKFAHHAIIKHEESQGIQPTVRATDIISSFLALPGWLPSLSFLASYHCQKRVFGGGCNCMVAHGNVKSLLKSYPWKRCWWWCVIGGSPLSGQPWRAHISASIGKIANITKYKLKKSANMILLHNITTNCYIQFKIFILGFTYKGSLSLPKRMNFRKNSKRPLTPPRPFFGKNVAIFSKNSFKRKKNCNSFF